MKGGKSKEVAGAVTQLTAPAGECRMQFPACQLICLTTSACFVTLFLVKKNCRLLRVRAFTKSSVRKERVMDFENILVALGKDDDLPDGTWH